MANLLNIYDPENKELVLGTKYFFGINRESAVKKAKELKAQFVYGLNPKDSQQSKQCTCHL